jgi:GT2 family glycosyltransferase
MVEHSVVGGRLDYVTLNVAGRPVVVDQHELEVHLGYMSAASSSNMALTRAVFDELGGFDESYASYGEDTDLSWRAQLAGYRLGYAKDAVMVWRPKGSTRDWLRQVFKVGRVGARLYRDYRGRGLRRDPLVPVARSGASIVLHAPSILRSKEQREFWAQWLAYRAGRLSGSLQQRVLFI